MEKEKREIYVEKESDDDEDDVTLVKDSDDENDQEYCYASIPTSQLQPRKVLSKGCWVSEMGMAEVEVQKGPIWRTTGIVRHGRIYCSIEEVLFLVELGSFLLMDDTGANISIEDVYVKLSDEKNGCSWDYFQAYRELKSLGYVVGRHGVPWSMKSVNHNSVPSSPKGSADNETRIESEDEIVLTELLGRVQIEEARPVFDVYPPNSKFRKSCPGDPSFVLCFSRGSPPSKGTLKNLNRECGEIPLKFCHVEQGKLSFYSFDEVELPVLP